MYGLRRPCPTGLALALFTADFFCGMFYILGNDGGQIGAPVIIGLAAGGTVLFILVLFILVVVMVVLVASCRRTRSRHDKLPGNH